MDLEIIDYDVEGAAYRDGLVVDGAYLLATVRRRGGADGSPAGDPTRLRLDVATLTAKERTALFAAFGELEAIVAEHATAHYLAQASDPKGLDATIAKAAAAAKEHEELARKLEAKRAELATLDQAIADKSAP